jgi:hypothetical protein
MAYSTLSSTRYPRGSEREGACLQADLFSEPNLAIRISARDFVPGFLLSFFCVESNVKWVV